MEPEVSCVHMEADSPSRVRGFVISVRCIARSPKRGGVTSVLVPDCRMLQQDVACFHLSEAPSCHQIARQCTQGPAFGPVCCCSNHGLCFLRYVSLGDVATPGYDQPPRTTVYLDKGNGVFATPEGFDLVSPFKTSAVPKLLYRVGGIG